MISISPSPPIDITLYVKSSYNEAPDSDSSSPSYAWLKVFGIILLVIIFGIIIAIFYRKDGKGYVLLLY